MTRRQFTKFSPLTVRTKRILRDLRLAMGLSMNEAARRLDISRKQLEDVETERNYGCHLDLELLVKCAVIYKTPIDEIITWTNGVWPKDSFFERPRVRGGQA